MTYSDDKTLALIDALIERMLTHKINVLEFEGVKLHKAFFENQAKVQAPVIDEPSDESDEVLFWSANN